LLQATVRNYCWVYRDVFAHVLGYKTPSDTRLILSLPKGALPLQG